MSGGMWAPFKELVSTVNAAVQRKEQDIYYNLEAELKKHKPDFISLLKNPARNDSHRAKLQKAAKDGLELPHLPYIHTLPQDFIDEALVLSNILNLNEISSIELLLAGEQQLSRFPRYTRGLIAVLLYHDGRRSIVSALRTLIQAREGVSWTLGLSPPIVNLITSFTDQLFEDGLVDKILLLLDEITVEGELKKLAEGKGVGGAQHRQDIVDFVTEQRTGLADCLFYWACQNPLPKDHTLKIVRSLQKMRLETPSNNRATFPGGQIARVYKHMDAVSLSLYHTLLACFNIGDNTAENAVDDSLIDEHYPLVADVTFVPVVHAEIVKEGSWLTSELREVVRFAWGVLLRECASRAAFTGLPELEYDEVLVEEAIKCEALHFLRQSIVASPQFHQEEFYERRIHWLVTSFIVNMHLKIKELRNLGDEVAKEISIRGGDMTMVPNGRRGFEELMRLIGDFYSTDPNNLQLSREFWPLDDSAIHQSNLHSRIPHRQISLSKFLSTCSNFLPSLLFSPFMYMLDGLSSSTHTAHHCFNMLKANSPTLGGGGASAAISLEHFFNSLRQYYLGLRNGGGARAPPTGCAISPQEVQGLKDVLTIISTIAKQDENARVVMYENQTWLPVASLFGLIGCPIPRDVKAKVMQTLATFALSPEIAGSMWHTLEAAQVLNTIHAPRDHLRGGVFGHQVTQEGSIEVELKEIESQAEEYPLTISFLQLLLVLVEVPIPPTLGAGHRVPGFQPYLKFVRDVVFLEFDNRAYQDRNEKWEVARLSLEIIFKLVKSHTISPEDFTDQQYEIPGGGVATLAKSPGHTLLEHLLNDSPLLKKILSVLDKSLQLLSTHGHTPPEGVSHAALLCLQLLGATLEREEEFLDCIRGRRKQDVSVYPLYKLLLGVNPNSGKADHLLNIAKYVGVTRCSPELSLAAVQVLHSVSMSPTAGKDMATTIMGDKDASLTILHGFVEYFESEVESPDQEGGLDSLDTVAGVHRAIQLHILKLLSLCIDMPAPNIAHFLLGFETGSGNHVSETILQDPGVSGSHRTCLHSILMLVEHGMGRASSCSCHYSYPQLAELCYKVLYQLCSHRDLSLPTLRYLRNTHDFLHVQLSHLPLDPSKLLASNGSRDVDHQILPHTCQLSLYNQQAWLMHIAAIELRMTLLNHQHSHTQRLLNLLLSEPNNGNGEQLTNQSAGMTSGHVRSEFNFLQEGRRKILVLLDLVDFADVAVPSLDMEYFDLSAVEGAIKMCEAKDPVSGSVYCDVKILYRMLMCELSSAQKPSLSGHQQSIVEEIHKILRVVVERNQVQASVHLAMELFESWRELVEIILHALLEDDIKRELKIAVLFEHIQDLLIKVAHCESTSLSTSVHGVIFILLSHLRQAVLSHPPSTKGEDLLLLPSLYSGPLMAIMNGIMENILKAPAGLQQVRAYLFGSLLYYLTMTHNQGTRDSSSNVRGGEYRLWQPDSDKTTVSAANLSALNSFGEPFMDSVCKNACNGHDVSRMLSLSVLDAMVTLDWQTTWLKFMSQHGYLQTLCASLQWDDDSLKKMLHPAPEALRALYIYESKMALLTRVADNAVGARELTSINALNYLSQCHFIDLRPNLHGDPYPTKQQHSHGFIPSVMERYQQLFFPLLKFLLALITCHGSHHKEVMTQVTSLIGAHSDVFAAILKEHHPVVTMATLQELALVTAIIGRSGVGHDWSPESATPLGSGLIRLQRLMLTLLPRFWSKQQWEGLVKQVVESEDNDGFSSDEAFLLVQQISANVVSYCRVAMTIGGTEFSSPYCRIFLSPDLSEALPTPPSKDRYTPLPSTPSSSRPPSLGLLIQHLKECTDSYNSAYESYQHNLRKMNADVALATEDIRKLLPRSFMAEKVPSSQQQILARKRLKTVVSNRKQEVEQYAYIVENLLYLLWRHLYYYMIHCKPVDPEFTLGISGIGHTSMRRMQEYTTLNKENSTFDLSSLAEGVRSCDLEQLKSDSVKCLTDCIFKKLLDLEEAQLQTKSDMKLGFIQAIVRRIKRLLKLKAAVRPF